MDVQIHDVVTAVVSFAAGFGLSVVMGREKFAEIQRTARERRDDIRERLDNR